MKRVLCSVLSLIMVCGLVLPVSANNSTDADAENKLDTVDVEVVPYSSDLEKLGEPETVETCRPASNTDIPDEPYPNENITWKLYSDGTLVISGTGEILRTCKEQYRDRIEKIIIEPGITAIGPWVFSCFYKLTSVEIPNGVTKIGEGAFGTSGYLTSIEIPNSVTTIGDWAFAFTRLESVVIPNSVKTIGEKAFRCCALTTVDIPQSVSYIGDGAFFSNNLVSINVDNNNANYTDINGVLYNKDMTCLMVYPAMKNDSAYSIPNSVTTISNDAFYYCSNLVTVDIPNSVEKIGENAFTACNSLASIRIPGSVLTIGRWAFLGCYNLASVKVDSNNANYSDINGVLFNKSKTSILLYPGGNNNTAYSIPTGVTAIGDYAFSCCNKLTSIVIPNSVTIIGDSAFGGCESLASIEIPNSVTAIGEGAFCGCRGLSTVDILNGVTVIGDWAFEGCDGLASIEIPASVTKVGKNAFGYCSNLTSINVDKNNKNYSDINGVLFNKDGTSILVYPAGVKNEKYTIPDGVKSIGKNAFAGCKNIRTIEIPNSVTTICEHAFDGCSIESIELPESVVSIEKYAFIFSSLKSITITNSVETIDLSAFLWCYGLSDVYFIGTEEEFENINIAEGNDYFLNAEIHYHTHEYTLKQNDKTTHKFVCSCGKTVVEDHSMQYTSDNPNTHTGKCECGYSVKENHNWVKDGKNIVCSVCGEVNPVRDIQNAVSDIAINIISNVTTNIINSISKWFPIFGK